MHKTDKLTRNIMEWFFAQDTKMFKDMNRLRKICEMHLQGISFKEIGEALNMDASYARYSIKRILRYVNRCQYLKEKAKESNPIEKMYNAFRCEIEEICTPEILKQVTTVKIISDDKDVGILCYIQQDGFVYIDALYIVPEYRRHQLARGAVLNWYEDFKDEEIRLHIVHKNEIAYKFWTSIFELEPIEINSIDTLYRVKGIVNYESSKNYDV